MQALIRRLALATAVLALTLQPDVTRAAGPFSGMAGEWSGGGIIAMTDGKRERLRCRANYAVDQDGNNVQLGIRCASDSYRFDLSGYVTHRGGSISGQWSETSYNSAGTLTGRASGNQLQALAIGNTFSARLTMATSGGRQSVTIRPEGTAVERVQLSLSKR